MNLPSEAEVIVVGGGPTGMALATILHVNGINAILIDAADQPQSTSRANIIHARTLDELHNIGVSELIIKHGLQLPGFDIRNAEQLLLGLDFRDLDSQHPMIVSMPQTALEDILRTKFESLGGYIHLDCQYLGCSQSGNSVNVTVQHRGERVTIAATYLVGADGHHSTVRTSLSIPFDGDVYPYSFIVAEVTVVEWPFGLNAAQIYTSLDGLLICMPEPGKHRFRLIANVRDAPQLPSLELWRCIIARRAPGHACFEIANMHCSNRFRIHHRIARRYRAGRIFLAGDAAHVQSPATGQGMNLGIQDATILARIIGDAIYHGRNSEHDLDEYQRICQPRAQKVFGLTHRITLGMTLTNPVLCWVRNMVMMATNSLPMVRRKITRVISQLDL